MKWIYSALVVCFFATSSGCGFSTKSEVDLDTGQFEGFPTYKVDQLIDEQIEVVVPIGSGTMEEVVEFEMSAGDNVTESSSIKTTTNWDIDLVDGLIATSLKTLTNLYTAGGQNLEFEVDEKLISSRDGKTIDYQGDLGKLESVVPPESIEVHRQNQPQWITQEYHLDELGTMVTTGYQIRPTVFRKDRLEPLLGAEMSSQMDDPEIVKGYGTYDHKKVVVTSYSVDKTFPDGHSTVSIKGEGYNLYDAQSFVHVRGEFLILMNVSDQKGKVFNMEVKINQRCEDYTVNGLIRAQ